MNRKFNKVCTLFIAQNSAGKSVIAQQLNALGYYHYSVREKIGEQYRDKMGHSLEHIRESFSSFAKNQKRLYGPEIFIREIVDDFFNSDHHFCVIESLRAPGEAAWIRYAEKQKLYPGMKFILIGITARKKIRKQRFLTRTDGLAIQATVEEFERQEHLCNNGTEEWSENISRAFQYADFILRNNTEEDKIGAINRIHTEGKKSLDLTYNNVLEKTCY